MSELLEDLDDLFPHTVTVTRRTFTNQGRPILGESFTVKGQISGRKQEIRTAAGQNVISRYRLIVKGDYNLKQSDKFTLPARFVPRSPEALDVADHTDEAGVHHQTVYF